MFGVVVVFNLKIILGCAYAFVVWSCDSSKFMRKRHVALGTHYTRSAKTCTTVKTLIRFH